MARQQCRIVDGPKGTVEIVQISENRGIATFTMETKLS